jgi:hypothetical protein
VFFVFLWGFEIFGDVFIGKLYVVGIWKSKLGLISGVFLRIDSREGILNGRREGVNGGETMLIILKKHVPLTC